MKKLTIAVTGGAGFIGSHIVDAYLDLGHRVVVIDNLSSGRKSNLACRAELRRIDITDTKRVRELFSGERFDIVNHHAAQIDVRRSVADPHYDARVNIMGTLNILENCRNYGVKKFIFASSGGTIYGECGKKAPDESFPGRPLSPYGITKHSIEFYLHFYGTLCGLDYTVLRYANVYGPRQDPLGEAGVVAIFSKRMLQDQKVLIFGNGEQTRDYVYVGDVVSANVRALAKGRNQIINIGTGKLTSVNGLFREMARLTGYGKPPVHKPARAGELMRSFLNARKAGKVLGWKQEVQLRSGLENTVGYFKNIV